MEFNTAANSDLNFVPGTSETRYLATVKGAPETLRSMFSSVPDNYDKTYLALSRRGARVLALGHRDLGTLSHAQLKELKRDDIEQSLKFAGFVIISCPMKPDSKSVIKELVASSHQVMMITGDNPLTACHVARQLKFCRTTTTLILTQGDDTTWSWLSVDHSVTLPLTSPDVVSRKSWSQFLAAHDLCLTGENSSIEKQFTIFIAYIVIFCLVNLFNYRRGSCISYGKSFEIGQTVAASHTSVCPG